MRRNNTVYRRASWRKIRYDFWIDDAAHGLSGVALAIRAMFEVRADVDDRQRVNGEPKPGIGWILLDTDRPMTTEMLSKIVKFPEDDVVTALSTLRDWHLVVQADSGAWGATGWAHRQGEDQFGNRRGLDRTFVYFVQAGEDGPIKIGVSNEPLSRMAEMQTCMPHTLRMLAFHPGTRAEEQSLHKRLAAFRIRGEWFHPCEEVLAALRLRNTSR